MRLVALGTSVLIGCGPAHVSLAPPPPPGAPVAERLAAYERLHAEDMIDVQRASRRGVGHDRYELELGDGTRVEAPEDLLAVVAEDSATAVLARSARAARRRGWALIALGILTDVTGLALAKETDPGPPRTLHAEPIAFAIGGTLVGGALMALGLFRTFDEEPAQHSAFHAYDADLQRRLHVCAVGFVVVAC